MNVHVPMQLTIGSSEHCFIVVTVNLEFLLVPQIVLTIAVSVKKALI